MRLACDIETNGLLQELTKIHCLSVRNIDSDEELFLTNENDIKDWAQNIEGCELIWHNGFVFDCMVFQKLYSIDLSVKNKIHDTIVMSQVLYSDLKDQDFKEFRGIPGKYIGKHSLAAWGHRLGEHKGDYIGGFDAYNDEMGLYCRQDTVVTKKLFKFLENKIELRTWR